MSRADMNVGETTSNGWTLIYRRIDSGCEFAVFTGPPARWNGLPQISVELNREEILRAATSEEYERLHMNLGDLANSASEAQQLINRLIMDMQMRNGSTGGPEARS